MQAMITLLVAHAVVGGSNDHNYKDAYQRSMQNGKPLMVVVGADWCPACVTLKNEIQALEAKDLLPVELSFVDKDAQPQLASKLMRGRSLPEIIFFAKTSGGWRRVQLNGAQSRTTLKSLIRSVADPASPLIGE